MGNVNMEASQINDRTGESKMSVAQHLKALDAIASTIEDLPTFTSNDRAFLEGLPAFPSEDGKKALVATTESGETSLDYEEIESSGLDYSTTEQKTGQKWIDGKDIYFDTIVIESPVSTGASTAYAHGISNIDKVINQHGFFALPTGDSVSINTYADSNYRNNVSAGKTHIAYEVIWGSVAVNELNVTIYYTKVESEE